MPPFVDMLDRDHGSVLSAAGQAIVGGSQVWSFAFLQYTDLLRGIPKFCGDHEAHWVPQARRTSIQVRCSALRLRTHAEILFAKERKWRRRHDEEEEPTEELRTAWETEATAAEGAPTKANGGKCACNALLPGGWHGPADAPYCPVALALPSSANAKVCQGPCVRSVGTCVDAAS